MSYHSDRIIKEGPRSARGGPSGRPQDFDDGYYKKDASSSSYYKDSSYDKKKPAQGGYYEDKYEGGPRRERDHKNNDDYDVYSKGNSNSYGDRSFKPKNTYEDDRLSHNNRNEKSYTRSYDTPSNDNYNTRYDRESYNAKPDIHGSKDVYQKKTSYNDEGYDKKEPSYSNRNAHDTYNKPDPYNKPDGYPKKSSYNDGYGNKNYSYDDYYNTDSKGHKDNSYVKSRGYDGFGGVKSHADYSQGKGYGKPDKGYDNYDKGGKSYEDYSKGNRGYDDQTKPNAYAGYGSNKGYDAYGKNDSSYSNGNPRWDQEYNDRSRESQRGGYDGPKRDNHRGDYVDYNDRADRDRGENRFGNYSNQSRDREGSYKNREGGEMDRPAYVQSKPKGGWASSRKRYEWGEDSEIPVEDPDLEKELFGEENHVLSGINFKKYQDIKVEVKGNGPPPIETFEGAGLHPTILANIKSAKYFDPTPVQSHTIPITLDGLDLMACAQTGSGKTAAFLLPVLSSLCKNPPKAKDSISSEMASSWNGYKQSSRRGAATPSALILAPTRELASQIFDECRRFAYKTKLRPCLLYGGASISEQSRELESGCDILTATPGRLKDFISRNKVNMRNIRFVVIDEADRMLEMSFSDDIKQILGGECPPPDKRQTMLFSATFPKAVRQMAKDYMRRYLFLAVGRIGGTTSDIVQKIEEVEDRGKRDYLMNILLNHEPCKTLIFVETKRGADTLDDFLYNKKLPCTSIHGERSQAEREDALTAFRKDLTPILIATAVAARGLDIKDVKHVINYDLPSSIDEYVHRIGRTARAGNKGTATSFFNQANSALAPGLIKLLRETKQEVPSFLLQYDYGHSSGFDPVSEDAGVPDEAEWNEIQTGYDNSYTNQQKNTAPIGWGDSSNSRKDSTNQNNSGWGNTSGNNWNTASGGWGNNSSTLSNSWDSKPVNSNQAANSWDAPNGNVKSNSGWDKSNNPSQANNGWDSGKQGKPAWETKPANSGSGWDSKPSNNDGGWGKQPNDTATSRPGWDAKPSTNDGGWGKQPNETQGSEVAWGPSKGDKSGPSGNGWDTKPINQPSWDSKPSAASNTSWEKKADSQPSEPTWNVAKEGKPTWGAVEPVSVQFGSEASTKRVPELNSTSWDEAKPKSNPQSDNWGAKSPDVQEYKTPDAPEPELADQLEKLDINKQE